MSLPGGGDVAATGSQYNADHHAPQIRASLLRASHDVALNSLTRPWRQRGRVIKRLITLNDNIADLIDEAARRGSLRDTQTLRQHSVEENRLYKNYQILTARLPDLENFLINPSNGDRVDAVIKQLTEGADSARADDASSLKRNIVSWIAQMDKDQPNPQRLSPYDKSDRGFHHTTTGRLLCPVDYDWNHPEHQDKIRDWHPDFLVTANSWPLFLYEDYKYDATDPSKGLFKGPILVWAFKFLFTSPSSADQEEIPPNNSNMVGSKRRRGERSTRAHVARLLKMKAADPRSIAYVAVQVRFALSDRGSWKPIDGLFNYVDFYTAIIRWFEDIDDLADKAFVDDLLLWWNRKVFGHEAVMEYAPQNAAGMSVAASFKRRRNGA